MPDLTRVLKPGLDLATGSSDGPFDRNPVDRPIDGPIKVWCVMLATPSGYANTETH
ncbi:MAG: hypothetical protein AAFR60_12010 [Pseudomonadota bacterium]